MNDLKFAFRQLLKNPGFTAIAVLTLALGIGANSAIFSVVRAVLLRPLPYHEPSRLVTLTESNPKRGFEQIIVRPANYFAWRNQASIFTGLAAEVFESFNVAGEGQPEHIEGAYVTANYFSVLGVKPRLGRVFVEGEDERGRHQVAVISHGLWQRRFGGRPDAVGTTIVLNDERMSIVGVLPPNFRTFNTPAITGRPTRYFEADVWVPNPLTPADRQSRSHFLVVIGRLKGDVTTTQAQQELNRIGAGLAQSSPATNRDWGVSVKLLHEQITGPSRKALLVLLGAVGFVLLIACANVANLFVARGAARRKEFALRSALGARRWQLIRQVLVESALLAVLGGALGLLTGDLIIRASAGVGPVDIPRLAEVRLDSVVLAFSVAASLVATLLSGVLPAVNVAATDVNLALKEGIGATSAGWGRGKVRAGLVVTQVAFTLLLLTGAGLMIRSFQRLIEVHPGFDRSHLIAMDLSLTGARFNSDARRLQLIRELRERIEVIPGIQSVATVHGLPFGGMLASYKRVSIEGRPQSPSDPPITVGYRQASPGYFRTMRIPLAGGREFSPQDTTNTPPVVIVNEAFARKYFPKEDALGKRLTVGPTQTSLAEIVGIIRDVKLTSLEGAAKPEVYLCHLQYTVWIFSIVARTEAEPTALARQIQAEILTLDKDLPIYNVRTLEQAVSASVSPMRFTMVLLTGFGGIALSLAVVGLYGVMSWSVSQRRREIGIRLAVGAQRIDVLTLILREGLTLVAIGLALGLVGAFSLAHLLTKLLYEIKPTDPLSFVGVSVLLVLVALFACLIPARRATKVDPMEALRYE